MIPLLALWLGIVIGALGVTLWHRSYGRDPWDEIEKRGTHGPDDY